jgi:TonB family protein
MSGDPVLIVARLLLPTTTLAPVELEAPRPIKTIRLPKRTARVTPPEVADAQPLVQPEPLSQPATEIRPEAIATAPPEVDAPRFDQGAIAKYRLQIISAARQFRRYPPIAREHGWQGRAEVRVSFEGSREPAVVLYKSSGYALLDRQAVETLTKALAPLPPALAGRVFELDFPVVFSLVE